MYAYVARIPEFGNRFFGVKLDGARGQEYLRSL